MVCSLKGLLALPIPNRELFSGYSQQCLATSGCPLNVCCVIVNIVIYLYSYRTISKVQFSVEKKFGIEQYV